MPTQINFYRKDTGERVALIALDEELCKHFKQPIDPHD